MRSMTLLFICFLALLSSIQVQARILIVCTQGCACVTEYGVSVRCDFLPDSEFAVLRAIPRRRGRYYTVHRVVEVGTVSTFGDDFSSEDPGCPNSAGSTPSTRRPICIPAPPPTKNPPPQIPDSGISVCNQDRKVTVSLLQNSTSGEGAIKIDSDERIGEEPDCPIVLQSVFAGCRPKMVRR